MYEKTCKNYSNLIQAFMVEGAEFSSNDIPFCPTTAKEIPKNLISYSKSITIYNDLMKNGNRHFFIEDYVHFYIYDYKFDGNKKGIWFNPYNALKILQHFAGIIMPNFSTYADYPFPIKIFNIDNFLKSVF